MVLGMPALCYTYSIDQSLYPHDLKMDQYKYRYYHYPTLRSDAAIICENREDINYNIKELLIKSKDPNINESCKLTVIHGIHTGKELASDRIINNR